MNLFKRAICNIKYNKMKNILICLLFSFIFAVTVGVLVVFTSMSSQLNTLEKGLGNCVTLRPINIMDVENLSGISTSIEYEDAQQYIDSDYVESFNINSTWPYTFGNGIEKYIADKDKYNSFMEWVLPTDIGLNWDATAYGLSDSSLDIAFTLNGYKLVKGRHISHADEEKPVCLISKNLAEFNGLDIGSEMVLELQSGQREYRLELEIVGLFEIPSGEYQEGFGNSPNDIVMTPITTLRQESIRVKEKTDFEVQGVSVYLKSDDVVNAFIEEGKTKLNVRNIYNTHIGNKSYVLPEDMSNMDMMEARNYYQENHWFDIQIDSEWYDMVGKPLEKVNSLMFVICIAVIVITFIIQVMLSVLLIYGRQKEIGILVSMGEKKSRIIAQLFTEDLLKLLCSMIIGILVGVIVGVSAVSNLGAGIYDVKAEDSEATLSQTRYEYKEQEIAIRDDRDEVHSASMDLQNRYSTRMKVYPNIAPKISIEAILIYFIIVFVLVIISICIEGVYIMRLSPVKLLLRRK